ncbi:hypothetical protein OR16_30499 [Cupriavidus basilensis OR16]|uniref:Uncharacterized protein n=1 Tax=Cupriavidus basilensis OR16 TaxID=1127483 RepID=H1SCY3_9BURK|nr:hypothetical protein [Cupriavidus basilensis]EHP39629.1 hypothetical protein OR16_30499 [Cupriavidus basilensis OR16]
MITSEQARDSAANPEWQTMHGRIQKGHWRLRANDLCMTYSTGKENAEECYQVWRSQKLIEYRRDDVTIAEGELVNK